MNSARRHTTRNGIKKYAMKGSLLIILAMLCAVCLGSCKGLHSEKSLGYIAHSEQEQSDAIMQNIADVLNKHDNAGLKKMFSTYALETQDHLDEDTENLMNFYQGSMKMFDGDCISISTIDHGKKTLVLLGTYTLTTSVQDYHIRFVSQVENDTEPNKVGLYLLQIVTEDTLIDRFYWKNEESDPGIYIQE